MAAVIGSFAAMSRAALRPSRRGYSAGAKPALLTPFRSTHTFRVENLSPVRILRTAKTGVRDPAVLKRMALMELQIAPRN